MGSIVTLVIYAALAAGALFAVHSAWTGFKEHVSAPYVQAQMAADQKVVTKANEGQAAAEGERDNAKEDTKACVVLAKKQTDLVDAWKKAADANAKAAAAALAKARSDATKQMPYIADLQAKAGAAPLLQSCELELREADKIMGDQLRRARNLPVTAPAVTPAAPPVLTK